MICRLTASVSAPGSTMPCASRPRWLMNRPLRPSAYALRAAPVDVREPVAAGGLRRIEVQQPCCVQPGVQVDAAPEALEAVVGDHHEVSRGPSMRCTRPTISSAALVHLQDRVAILLGVAAAVGRMLAVEVAEEHVLQAVGAVEHADDRAVARLLERVEEHALALRVMIERLLQERLLVDHALVQRPGVLGEAERRELAQQLRQVDRVDPRPGDRQRRLARIDVDRRDVQVEVRRAST